MKRPETVKCAVCEDEIKTDEPFVFTRHRASPAGIAAIHKLCTKEAMERWLREDRPHSSPKEAGEALKWRFTGTHDGYDEGGRYIRPGHVLPQRLWDAREGNLKWGIQPIQGHAGP